MADTETRSKKKRDESSVHIVKLVLIVLFLIVACFFWLDYLGLLSFNRDVMPVIAKIPGMGYVLPKRTEDPYLLAREEEKKLEYIKQIEWEKLREKEEQLNEMKMKLEEKEKELAEQQDRIKEKEKKIDDKYKVNESYKEKVMQQATYLIGMKPEDAVQRIANLEDLLVIDIFRAIEKKAQTEGSQSIVPYFLSLMDPKRSSVIQRKMTVVEEDIIKGTNQ